MEFFCASLRLHGGRTDFNVLRRMCAGRTGCAYVSREFSAICTGGGESLRNAAQPLTVSHNGHPYTAVVLAKTHLRHGSDVAAEVLEGYLEEGQRYIQGLDFPFSMLIYDGRCAELLACRSSLGGFGLFMARCADGIYFCSSLTPLFRAFLGCVRVDRRVLRSYLCGECGSLPDRLFCDIRPIGRGEGVLCTRLGESEVELGGARYGRERTCGVSGVLPQRSYAGGVERVLEEVLFTYGYPCFDLYMPSFIEEGKRAAAEGIRNVRIQDGTYSGGVAPALERARLLSAICGADVTPTPARATLASRRAMRAMEKDLDALLREYLSDRSCVLHTLLDKGDLEEIYAQKSIPLRIRKKGMLCQTVTWLRHFNISFYEQPSALSMT